MVNQAREVGNRTEALLAKRLAQLDRPVEIRRFDVLADDIARIASREARSADTFVALRPNGSMDPDRLVEGVLFGSGRHLYLIPEVERPPVKFSCIVVAWNGSRESTRALAEAMPFLHMANKVAVVVVTDDPPTEEQALLGADAIHHLAHHGIDATLHRVPQGDDDVGETLVEEALRQKADMIVMGGYGHSRLREWLLGGVTYNLMHDAPIPLLMAH
jgi:nucleotide-binding universal stress UspA family protein